MTNQMEKMLDLNIFNLLFDVGKGLGVSPFNNEVVGLTDLQLRLIVMHLNKIEETYESSNRDKNYNPDFEKELEEAIHGG
jgi:hypothetical protein